MYCTLYGESPDLLPSLSFVRECRVVLQVMVEEVVALQLGKAKSWDQMYNDATSRGHRHFSVLIMGIIDPEGDGTNESIVIS